MYHSENCANVQGFKCAPVSSGKNASKAKGKGFNYVKAGQYMVALFVVCVVIF